MTKLEYVYRDASNYKSYGYVLLEGSLSKVERDEITSRLESATYFIAEQLGIPVLYKSLYKFSDGPTSSDHCWHEVVQLREFEGPMGYDRVWGTVEQLLSKFRTVSEWDVHLSPHIAVL